MRRSSLCPAHTCRNFIPCDEVVEIGDGGGDPAHAVISEMMSATVVAKKTSWTGQLCVRHNQRDYHLIRNRYCAGECESYPRCRAENVVERDGAGLRFQIDSRPATKGDGDGQDPS